MWSKECTFTIEAPCFLVLHCIVLLVAFHIISVFYLLALAHLVPEGDLLPLIAHFYQVPKTVLARIYLPRGYQNVILIKESIYYHSFQLSHISCIIYRYLYYHLHLQFLLHSHPAGWLNQWLAFSSYPFCSGWNCWYHLFCDLFSLRRCHPGRWLSAWCLCGCLFRKMKVSTCFEYIN